MELELAQGAGTKGQTHVVFILLPRFNLSTLITMMETMRIGNYLSSPHTFSWEMLSFDGPRLTSSNGFRVTVNTDPDSIHDEDMIFVLGSWGAETYTNRALVSWLRKRSRLGARICAVEMGCFIVARAGLLDGRTATAHWSYLSGLKESHDTVNVVEQLFTIDDRVMTCGGGLAGVDLMLRLIEEIHGAGLSGEIADQMLHTRRQDSAPQRHTMAQASRKMAPVVRQTIELIEKSIAEPLSVPDIAEMLGLSQRQLERNFKKYMGCSVVQFGLLLRLQHARVLLISTSLSVREVAIASGFNTLSHFAFSFRKCFGRRPSEYREAWPSDQAAPNWPGTLSEFLAALQKRNRRKQA